MQVEQDVHVVNIDESLFEEHEKGKIEANRASKRVAIATEPFHIEGHDTNPLPINEVSKKVKYSHHPSCEPDNTNESADNHPQVNDLTKVGKGSGASKVPENTRDNWMVFPEATFQREMLQKPIRPALKKSDSIFLPAPEKDLRKSIKYSLEVLSWLSYQSFILAFPPAVFTVGIFGILWGINITQQSYLFYYISFNFVFNIMIYLTVSMLMRYMFGKRHMGTTIYTITLPCGVLHATTFTVKCIREIEELSLIYYATFIIHFYVLIRYVQSRPLLPTSESRSQARFNNLVSDGTPAILFMGLIPNIVGYYISSHFIAHYLMNLSITTRILSRIVILPFVYNIIDTYQNSLVVSKSRELLPFRMLFGNIFNFVFMAILRFIVTDSSSILITTIMALCSGISEVIFRVSYIPRSIYTMRILEHIKFNISKSCILSKKVHSLDNIAPADLPRVGGPSIVVQDFKQNKKRGSLFSFRGIQNAIAECNAKDGIANHILLHRAHRSSFTSMCEIQFIFYAPLIMFLLQPIEEYITMKVIRSVQLMILSILIQLTIEIITQIVSISLEHYLFGINIPVNRSWDYNLKSHIIIQSISISLTIAFLSSSPFLLSPSEWNSK